MLMVLCMQTQQERLGQYKNYFIQIGSTSIARAGAKKTRSKNGEKNQKPKRITSIRLALQGSRDLRGQSAPAPGEGRGSVSGGGCATSAPALHANQWHNYFFAIILTFLALLSNLILYTILISTTANATNILLHSIFEMNF